MLGASSFSLLSQSVASSGYSESVELDIVDEIIERAPRSATAFPLVYKAYVSTLQDNGLSPANDTAYYQFLLKLQVIRAGTWGEKWDLWRATNFISASAPVEPKSRGRSADLNDTSRLAEVRARVPFLSGASSDLDDAFAETSYSADGESVTESESPVQHLRPSPRKSIVSRRTEAADHSCSLVGYTPDHSDDLSSLGLDLLPARTSTPVNAHHRTIVAATPPPYSVSEATASVSEQYDLTAEDTQLIEGLATPKASAREWEEQRMIQEEAVMEMERRADQFYETGLIGRCFDVWTQANEWIQIDTVRTNILLRQCLQQWRDEHDRILSLPNTADTHRQHSLQAQALRKWIRRYKDHDLTRREARYDEDRERAIRARTWDRWRSEVIRIRTHRWEKDMRGREKRFTREKENGLVRDVFDRWRGETRTRIDTRLALSFDADRVLSRAFVEWHYRLEQKERLEGQLAVFQRTKDRRLSFMTLGTWVQRARLNREEAGWLERTDLRVLRSTWEQWRLTSTRIAQADSLLRKSTLRKALQRWTTAKAKLRVLDRKAAIFRQAGEHALLRKNLTAWTVAEREVLLVRVRDQRLQKEVWQRWIARLAGNELMHNQAVEVVRKRNKQQLVTVLHHWQIALATHQSRTRQAGDHYSSHRLSTALNHWRAGSAKIQRDRQTADKAHAFFLLRQAFGVWKAQLAGRKQQRFLEEKKIELVRRVFDHWREETQRSIEGNRQADDFRQICNQRLLGKTLSQWTTRVIQLKSRQLDVSEQRDTHLLHLSLSSWTGRMRRIRDAHALADSCLIVKGEDRLRDALRVWREAATRKRKRREAEAVAARERRGRLLSLAWDRWRERVVERSLQPIEEEVSIRHEDAILFRVWDTWKAQATLLPALTFDNRRIKKKAWASLRRAMERSIMMREFGGPRDRRLLEDVLAVWREKTQTRVVARAGRLRGRLRPTALPVRPIAARRVSSVVLSDPAPTGHPRPASLTILQHARSSSHNRHIRTEPASPVPDDIDAESVYSEPAYSRLRSELARPRHRGVSEEPEVRSGRRGSTGRSELINALRGGMGGR